MAQASQNSSRAAALARRKAMSSAGKAALKQKASRVRQAPERQMPEVVASKPAPVVAEPAPKSRSASSYRPKISPAVAANSSRAAALERRKAMSTRGKSAARSNDRTRDQAILARSQKSASDAVQNKPEGCACGSKDKAEPAVVQSSAPRPTVTRRTSKVNKPKVAVNTSKAAALARRKALSSRGKAGVSAGGMTQAQTARAANPTLSSRELAQTLREQRSQRGKAGEKKCRPSGRQRVKTEVGAAQDAPWKVGVSQTARGQSVTGTMVGRDKDVTGDEASTCRVITGTEYMGADLFRAFCQAEPSKTPMRSGVSATTRGNTVTGNEVGRSNKVTGDEPGTCKNVTGTEYMSAGQMEAFCAKPSKPAPQRATQAQTHKGKTVTGDNVGSFANVTGGEAGSDRQLTGAQYMQSSEPRPAPAKVQVSHTLRGRGVTGIALGRSDKTTGDEPGSCRRVTGDDYVGQEQYSNFCGTQAEPGDAKVGASKTFNGMTVTGTMEGRTSRVTGNEPGTCKSITGTPYAGVESYAAYCETSDVEKAAVRAQRISQMSGKNLTGQQPEVGGKMTGDDKGACEHVTGTPYIGADQMAQACPAIAAEPSSSDFPQAVGDTTGWGAFSVTAPSHAAAVATNTGVTGSRYDQGKHGQITGPFGMANGKVTGTEDARFGNKSANLAPAVELIEEPQMVDGRVKSRISGEGMDAGTRITGDDWDRGDRVTGTEGVSARMRNTSVRGAAKAVPNRSIRDVKNDAPQPVSRVTGSSGNYENGSLITYSGGARG